MTSTATSTLLPDSPAGVLAALRSEQETRRASEVRSMELAAHWVALHPAADSEDPDGCFQSPKSPGREHVGRAATNDVTTDAAHWPA